MLLTVSVSSGVAGSSSPGGRSALSSWVCSACSTFWLWRHRVLSSWYSSGESTALGSWLFRCSLNLTEHGTRERMKLNQKTDKARRCMWVAITCHSVCCRAEWELWGLCLRWLQPSSCFHAPFPILHTNPRGGPSGSPNLLPQGRPQTHWAMRSGND